MRNPDLVNVIFEKTLKPSPMVEFTVNSELGPFLVSSSRSFIWRDTPKREHGKEFVLAAVRELSSNPQAEAISAVIERSLEEEWGSVFPFTKEGFEQCLEYLQDLEADILVNGDDEIDYDEDRLIRTEWVPPGCAVFLAEDRRQVGDFVIFERTDYGAACLFNTVYGMAFATDV